MCRSIAEGGQRCASHTRPAYEAACRDHGVGGAAWLTAASEYASTPEGEESVRLEVRDAALAGDWDREAALEAALTRGRLLREVNNEARRQIIAKTTDTPIIRGEPTRLLGDTAAYDEDGAVMRVYGPHDRRVRNVRYVVDPGGQVWSFNKHGVALSVRPDGLMPGWGAVDFGDADMQRRVARAVRHADPAFKRCGCCGAQVAARA